MSWFCKRPSEQNYRIRLVTNRCVDLNTLNAELNPICHLLALLGAHHILHVSRIRVKHLFTLRQNFPVGVAEDVERVAFLFQFRQLLVPFIGQGTVNLDYVFDSFNLSSLANSGTVPATGPRTLPFKILPITD